jgi:hypothetical protein
MTLRKSPWRSPASFSENLRRSNIKISVCRTWARKRSEVVRGRSRRRVRRRARRKKRKMMRRWKSNGYSRRRQRNRRECRNQPQSTNSIDTFLISPNFYSSWLLIL